ncbi:MAG TPA: tyrosinase family protein [Bryobacteraceae bacterium]
MAQYTRRNVWNQGGGFDNPDLRWYAIGVYAMQQRKLNDTSSWWFFAAIHGQSIQGVTVAPGDQPSDTFYWGTNFPTPPAVPTSPLPAQKVIDQYWDQCQHGSWYFPPWHRGYLIALEAQIRAAVVAHGGPADWALPYWDYTSEPNMPPAFTAGIIPHGAGLPGVLPDGSLNPLFVAPRHGPDFDGAIYVPNETVIKVNASDPNFAAFGPVNEDCLSERHFTGAANLLPPGFGGGKTGFSFNGSDTGGLENNPHNLVHVYVGGLVFSQDGQTVLQQGYMADPDFAALDPIFYIHHSNIDRLWAVWNTDKTHTNPTDQAWLKGPASSGGRPFVMPMPDGTAWKYTPADLTSLSQVNYTYQQLQAPPAAPSLLSTRLESLGVAAPKGEARPAAPAAGGPVELVGANGGPLPIVGNGAQTSVRLDTEAHSKVVASLRAASPAAPPDRVYLKLENVQGLTNGFVLSCYINLPAGAKPAAHPELLAGSVGLFGLRNASQVDGKHGGHGLNFVLDITKVVDKLYLDKVFDTQSLQVTVVPHHSVPESARITIGQISIYRGND